MVADGLAASFRSPENRVVTGARVAAVVVVGALGALFAFGSLIAALFELQGFGDRDGDPDTAYLALQASALALSVAVPLLAWRLLLPRSFSLPVAAAAAGVALLGVAWMLGTAL